MVDVPQVNVVLPFLSDHADEGTNEGNCPNDSLWLSWIVREVC